MGFELSQCPSDIAATSQYPIDAPVRWCCASASVQPFRGHGLYRDFVFEISSYDLPLACTHDGQGGPPGHSPMLVSGCPGRDNGSNPVTYIYATTTAPRQLFFGGGYYLAQFLAGFKKPNPLHGVVKVAFFRQIIWQPRLDCGGFANSRLVMVGHHNSSAGHR